jgi:hypothetical protein
MQVLALRHGPESHRQAGQVFDSGIERGLPSWFLTDDMLGMPDKSVQAIL